jgi:hypothetical protein
MTRTTLSRLLPVLALVGAGGCDYDIANPNSPAVIGENPSAAQVGAAANGILIATRQDIADWALDAAIWGREAFRIDPADPRFVQEMMQGPLDPGSRAFGGDHWLEPYSAIRSANDLLAVISTASSLTAEQQSATSGFAHTLQAYNFTIVLSSHILTELTEMCDTVAVIEKGRLLATGTVQEILEGLRPRRLLSLRVAHDAEATGRFLLEHPGVSHVHDVAGDVRFEFDGNDEGQAALLGRLVAAGFPVLVFTSLAADLEDAFIEITERRVS